MMYSVVRWGGNLLAIILFLLPLSGEAMEVGPASIELSLDPGTAQTRSIHVRNNEDTTKTYYLQLQKFLPRGEQGQQEFLAFDDVQGLPSWTYLPQSSITLRPNEAKTIPLTIRIPEDASPGGYYEAIFIASAPFVRGQTPTSFRTGVLLLVEVKGTITKRLRVVGTELLSPSRVAHSPIHVRFTMENQGGIHAAPSGFLIVRNWRRQIVERIPFNEEHAFILPASRRQFFVAWGQEAKQEALTDSFWSQVRREWRDGFIGPYQLRLEFDQQEERLPSIHVFIWPWHLLLIFGLGAVLLLSLLRIYRGHILRQATQKK